MSGSVHSYVYPCMHLFVLRSYEPYSLSATWFLNLRHDIETKR